MGEVYTISALFCLHECASERFNNKNLTEKDNFQYECGSWFMYRQQPCVDFEVHMSFQSRDGFLSIPWHIGQHLPKCQRCHLSVATRCDRSRGNARRELANRRLVKTRMESSHKMWNV